MFTYLINIKIIHHFDPLYFCVPEPSLNFPCFQNSLSASRALPGLVAAGFPLPRYQGTLVTPSGTLSWGYRLFPLTSCTYILDIVGTQNLPLILVLVVPGGVFILTSIEI